jgi:hypothetical protein
MLGLGLDQGDGDRLRVGVDLDAQCVINAPLSAAPRPAAN